MQTETYYTTEPRQHLETYLAWETVYERFLNIPVYNVYTLRANGVGPLLVYRTMQNNRAQYWLQNPQYWASETSARGFWGRGNVRVLTIDADSDGRWFEDEDRILFNNWNPYARDSRYHNVTGLLENYWYRISDLKQQKFISFDFSPKDSRLAIFNANDQYVGIATTGQISIVNLPGGRATITINGERYSPNRDGAFEGKIEYGRHRLRISQPGFEDYEQELLVNDQQPQVSLSYSPAGSAGVLEIQRIGFREWKVAIEDKSGTMTLYEQQNRISLKPGEYVATVASGGLNIKVPITITKKKVTNIDVEAEIQHMQGKIPTLKGVQEALPDQAAPKAETPPN